MDSEQYSDSPLYQKLCETKPEYGSDRRIQVKLVEGEIAITNVHVGSMGDIITYQVSASLLILWGFSFSTRSHLLIGFILVVSQDLLKLLFILLGALRSALFD